MHSKTEIRIVWLQLPSFTCYLSRFYPLERAVRSPFQLFFLLSFPFSRLTHLQVLSSFNWFLKTRRGSRMWLWLGMQFFLLLLWYLLSFFDGYVGRRWRPTKMDGVRWVEGEASRKRMQDIAAPRDIQERNLHDEAGDVLQSRGPPTTKSLGSRAWMAHSPWPVSRKVYLFRLRLHLHLLLIITLILIFQHPCTIFTISQVLSFSAGRCSDFENKDFVFQKREILRDYFRL